MNLRIIHTPFTEVLDRPLRELGHSINGLGEKPDAIILMSISKLDELRELPDVPLFVYDWDLYPGFIIQNTYPWAAFADVKRRAKSVWVPSEEVAKRNKELYGITNCVVVPSFARLFKTLDVPVTKGDYVFHGMREYPWDAQNGWAKQACTELGIHLVQSEHRLTEEEYQKTVAGCRLAVCEFEEASTGGLTLIEAHAHGKPVLYGDGPYMGAQDYFGERGHTYHTGDYEDFKTKLAELYANTPEYDIDECWCWASRFSTGKMAQAIDQELQLHVAYRLD